MGFRDDGEAARARAEALEKELEDAKKELERLRVDNRLATEEADRLRKRLAQRDAPRSRTPNGPPPAPDPNPAKPEPSGSEPAPHYQTSSQGQAGPVLAVFVLGILVVGAVAVLLGRQGCRDMETTQLEAEQRADELAAEEEERAERERFEDQRALREWDRPQNRPDGAPAFDPIRRFATVLRVTGRAPVEAGGWCRLDVTEGAREVLDCHVEVKCGEVVLYGQDPGASTPCVIAERSVTAAHDDGNPSLDLDFARQRVLIERREPTYTIELFIAPTSPAPR